MTDNIPPELVDRLMDLPIEEQRRLLIASGYEVTSEKFLAMQQRRVDAALVGQQEASEQDAPQLSRGLLWLQQNGRAAALVVGELLSVLESLLVGEILPPFGVVITFLLEVWRFHDGYQHLDPERAWLTAVALNIFYTMTAFELARRLDRAGKLSRPRFSLRHLVGGMTYTVGLGMLPVLPWWSRKRGWHWKRVGSPWSEHFVPDHQGLQRLHLGLGAAMVLFGSLGLLWPRMDAVGAQLFGYLPPGVTYEPLRAAEIVLTFGAAILSALILYGQDQAIIAVYRRTAYLFEGDVSFLAGSAFGHAQSRREQVIRELMTEKLLERIAAGKLPLEMVLPASLPETSTDYKTPSRKS